MSYRSRRLNRPLLRPGLQKHKESSDQVESQTVTPDTSAPASQEIIDVNGPVTEDQDHNIPTTGHLRHAMRPSIHRAAAYSTDAGMLEKAWDRPLEASRSSASTWGMLLVILITLVWGAGFLIGFQAALAILLAIGLVFSIAGLASPGLGMLAIGMVAALDAMANIFLLTGGLFRYNTLNYFLLLVILLNIPFVLRLTDFNSRSLQLFLLLMFFELSFSKSISTGVQDILNIGATFGMVVYFARALKDELSLYWLGIVNGVLAGLGGLVFLLQMDKLPYANPNDWTYFPLTALFSICVSYPFAVKYHKNRLILLALAAVNFAWVFLSASRGSLLVALLAGTYLFLSTRSITWKTIMIVVAVAVGIWISSNFAEQQLTTISRIQDLFNPNISATKRTSKRSVIADVGWQIFLQNPMGIGTGGFAEESTNTGQLASQRPAHSAWIQVLAENGVLGALFLAVFVGSYAIVGFRKHQEGKLLFALFITLVFASAFIAKEFRGKSLWFLAAAGIVLLHPEEILAYLNQKTAFRSVNDPQKIRKVRFGRH
jgi:hypothetical protein